MSKHLLGFAIGKCNIEQISGTNPPDYRYGFNSNSELKSFAQAVIEDYKSGLVPVGEVSGNDWSMGLLYEDCEPGTPLYMLPKE